MIEGRGGRLAAELDGDDYHGPDRLEADRQRQAAPRGHLARFHFL
jgi:hypothetical protein